MITDEVKVDILKARVYFEGVLFPHAKTINVSLSPGGATCTIDVPPSPSLKTEQLIGMNCEVYYGNLRVIDLFGNEKPNSMPSDEGWPLLFEGDFLADSSSSGVSSESLTMTFKSKSRHFDQTLLYFYDPLNQDTNTAIAAQSQATFIGNSVIQLDTDGVLSRQSQIVSVLEARLKELDDLPNGANMAFQVAVLEILRAARENHVLFGYFDDKHNLTDRFAAYSDPDVRSILQLTQFKNLIENHVSKMGAYTSLMSILEMCTQIMQYDWVNISQPRFLSPESDSPINPDNVALRPELFGSVAERYTKQILKLSSTQPTTLFNAISVDPTYWTTNSKMVLVAEFNEMIYREYKKIATDSVVAEDLESDVLNAVAILINQGYRPVLSKEAPLDDSLSESERALNNTNFTKKDNPAAAVKEIDKDRSATGFKLNQYMVVPSMHFAQPPKCNVIFPSEMQLYGISRDYLSELTRLYATVYVMPSQSNQGAALTEWYIAPSSQSYHYLDEGFVSRLDDEYKKFIDENLTVAKDEPT